ncbi:MAG: DUF6273 domain-containing protein [Oscillospiraceae bacterium]|jgi:hypothetical protein|nr:DUF6273 domain-containing protein [Oscillospiraceae bacterium]
MNASLANGTKSRKLLAIILAVVLLLGSIAGVIATTLAAKSDLEVTIDPPTNGYLALEVGQIANMTVGNLFEATSSDQTIAVVTYTPGSDLRNLHTLGVKAGTMTTAYGAEGGAVRSQAYQVTDSNNITKYILAGGGEGIIGKPGGTLTIPVRAFVTPHGQVTPVESTAAKSTITWSTFRPYDPVAEVSASGEITAKAKGVTIILGQFTDKWGRQQDIHFLIAVGVSINDSSLGELLDLIERAEGIIALEPNPYTDDSISNLEEAKDAGIAAVGGTEEEILAAIDDLKDALDDLDLRNVGGIIGPDANGNYYKPVGDPKNVYEVVDKDGNSKQPPEYVYDADGNPKNGVDGPAYHTDGNNYYIQDPENIFKKVDHDGSIIESPAIWGGEDKILGTGDDKPVVKFDDGYYIDLGQNIWQKVTPPTTLGPIVGGGPDLNPATNPVVPIVKNGDKYYIGPLTDGSDIYYYGDKQVGGDGKVNSTASTLDGTDEKYHLVNGVMVPEGGTILGPDDNGNYYKPVGDPENVFEVVDGNGNPTKQPPDYVYAPDGDPVGGADDNTPAYPKDGNYYVEDPEGSNIYKKVDSDGDLIDTPAIWGGGDGKLGGTDDKPVVKYGDDYYVDLGQNIFQKVDKSNPTQLDPTKVGGGPDLNPATGPVTPIDENNGKYYVGPLGPDADGNNYYYGDKKIGGDNLVESTADTKHSTDDKYYLVDGTMTTDKPSQAVEGIGTPATGRVVTPAMSGDSVNWYEIATNGGYSLIVRDSSVASGVAFHTPFEKNTYSDSNLRNQLNNWYKNTLTSAAGKLKSYAVYNNVLCRLGHGSQDINYLNGYSVPSAMPAGLTDNDIVFALSFQEAMRFCSNDSTLSTATAKANWALLSDRNGQWWLRSPDINVDQYTAANNLMASGTLQRSHVTLSMNARPAMWIKSDIFDITFPSVPGSGTPTVANTGRLIDGTKIGDSTSDWLEIATMGDYSLIIRKGALSGTVYYENALSKPITWYKTSLPAASALRPYISKNDGGWNSGDINSLTAGRSKPTGVLATTSDTTTCFLLSYGEFAQYCSKTAVDVSTKPKTSPAAAQANADLVTKEAQWSSTYTPGTTLNCGYMLNGAVDGKLNESPCTVHPAMWILSSAFDTLGK